VSDIYRNEDPRDAIARLRAENQDLQVQNAAVRQRLQQIEARVGIRPPLPRSSLGARVAIVVATLLAGAFLVMGFIGRRAARVSLQQNPDPASVGVPECDAYVAKWNACYTDPTMRAAAQPSFDLVRQEWKKIAAADPSQRTALANACAQMVENFPEASCQSATRPPSPPHKYRPPPDPSQDDPFSRRQ
jgi:hypothetical protein